MAQENTVVEIKVDAENYNMISHSISLHTFAAQKSIVEKYYGEIWWENIT